MTEQYDYKIIVSGKHLEKYEYWDKFVFKNYKKKRWAKRITENKIIKAKEQTEFTKSSLNRTRTDLRRLVNTNNHLNKFITLTFGSEMYDLKPANYIFNLFTQRMTDQFPEFQYIAVPEFQPISQRVHYHLLSNLRYVPNEKIAQIWGQGYIKINRIDKVSNVGAYVSKYLTKETCDKRLFHKKKFFCSTKLNAPFELTGSKAFEYFNQYAKDIKPEYEKEFNNEYLGKVSYQAYLLNSVPPPPRENKKSTDKNYFMLRNYGLLSRESENEPLDINF